MPTHGIVCNFLLQEGYFNLSAARKSSRFSDFGDSNYQNREHMVASCTVVPADSANGATSTSDAATATPTTTVESFFTWERAPASASTGDLPPPNPITWFATLAPPGLKMCQSEYQTGLPPWLRRMCFVVLIVCACLLFTMFFVYNC